MKLLSRSARLYLTATIWWGEFILLWYGFRSQPGNLWLAVVLGLLSGTAQILHRERATGDAGSGLNLFIFSICLLSFGLPETTLVVLISCLATWLWYRDPWQVTFFNIGRFSTAAWAAGLVSKSLVIPSGFPSTEMLTPVLLTPLTFVLVNGLLTNVFAGLSHGEKLYDWSEFSISELAGDFSLMSMGAVFVRLWQISPTAGALVAVPALVAYRAMQRPLSSDRGPGALQSNPHGHAVTQQQIMTLNSGLMETLAEAIDLRDSYTLGHSRRVAHYGVLIATQMELPADQVELIRKAGLLHDIGKLGIRDELLFKPGELTTGEYEIVKHTPSWVSVCWQNHWHSRT